MKSFLTVSSLLVFVVVAMSGCYNDKYDQLYPAPVTTVDLCDTATNPATYSGSVKATINEKCASTGCHDATTHQNGYDMSKYATDSAITDRIKIRITQGTMPPISSSQLSDCQKKQIFSWVNHGAQNN